MDGVMKYFEHYNEVKKTKPYGLRGQLRNAALTGLSVVDKMKGIERDLQRPRVQFLYIHHTFKDEEAKLDNLLKRLAVDHAFIPYSEAVERVLERRIDKPYISISSDDGFKNNLRTAEILDRYGAKGCFFINPSVIGETDFATIAKHCKDRLSFPPVEFLDWDEVGQLQQGGHEVGSHTMDHINVAETSPAAFADDCAKTYETLTRRCGSVSHFAFPYGRFFHFNERARKTVFEAGFISCATAERGCHIDHGTALKKEELCILRDHVVLDWPIDHIFHFLAKNSRNAVPQNNLFPY